MPLTVLVVEDYPEVRELVAEIFRAKGCRVLEATDGHEAIMLAHSEDVNLVLMDLDLPLIDGYTATRAILSNPSNRHLPIVAFSANCSEERRQKALDAGCVECLEKPAEVACIEQLLELVRTLSPPDEKH